MWIKCYRSIVQRLCVCVCVYVCVSTLVSSRSVDQLCKQHVTKSGVVSPPWCTPQASRRCPLEPAPTAAIATSPTARSTVAVAASAASGNKTNKTDSSCRHSVTPRHVIAAMLTKSWRHVIASLTISITINNNNNIILSCSLIKITIPQSHGTAEVPWDGTISISFWLEK